MVPVLQPFSKSLSDFHSSPKLPVENEPEPGSAGVFVGRDWRQPIPSEPATSRQLKIYRRIYRFPWHRGRIFAFSFEFGKPFATGAATGGGTWLALWAGRKYGGLSLREAGEKAGGLDYVTVSVAVRRVEQRATQDRTLQAALTKVSEICKKKRYDP